MGLVLRTYGCVTLAVFLWACRATGHATLHNLGVSLRLALTPSLAFLVVLSLGRLVKRRAKASGIGGDPLDAELFRFPTGDPFRLRHLLTSVCVWGVIGSGKSSSSGLFFARILLRLNSSGLVLASNPDDASWWSDRFAEADRADDLVIFSKKDKHRLNFLAEMQSSGADPRELTAFLVTASECLMEGGAAKAEAYWKLLSERMLYNIIMPLMLAGYEVSAARIANFLSSVAYSRDQLQTEAYRDGFCAEVLARAGALALDEIAAGDFAGAFNFWTFDFIVLDPRPRSSALSMVENITHTLGSGYARVLFSTTTTQPLGELDTGKWFLLDFPVSAEGPTGKLIYACAKLAVQRRILKNSWKSGQPVTCIWADEAWHITNKGDRDFLAESRKHGGVLVYLTQSLLNYQLAMGGDESALARAKSFVGMFGTTIVHSADVSTAEYMCSLVGEAEHDETSASYSPAREVDAQALGAPQWSGSVTQRRQALMTTRDFTANMRMGGRSKIVDAWVHRTVGFSTGLNITRMEFKQD